MPSNPSSVVHKVFSTNRRLLVEEAVNKTVFSKYKRVLVIGAGHDPYRSYFTHADTYVSMDIELIKDRVSVVGDAHCLPFQDQSFDCVLAVEVLEHLEQADYFFSELYRVLDVDGFCLLTVPFMFHIHGDPFDYGRYTPYKLKLMLSDFRKVDIYPQGNRLHVISDLFTTSKIFGYKLFVPLRFFNRLIARWATFPSKSSAPSGLVINLNK